MVITIFLGLVKNKITGLKSNQLKICGAKLFSQKIITRKHSLNSIGNVFKITFQNRLDNAKKL